MNSDWMCISHKNINVNTKMCVCLGGGLVSLDRLNGRGTTYIHGHIQHQTLYGKKKEYLSIHWAV